MDDSSILVSEASVGDSRAIEELVERHLPTLLAYVRLKAGRLVLAKESAADLVQSVCREIFEKELANFRYEGEARFRAWICRLAYHKITERARHWGARRRAATREAAARSDESLAACYHTILTPSRVAVAREDLGRFEEAFQKLPDDYREVVVMSRVLGLSHAEIGEQLGKSEVAVRSTLSRALARLTTLLAPS